MSANFFNTSIGTFLMFLLFFHQNRLRDFASNLRDFSSNLYIKDSLLLYPFFEKFGLFGLDIGEGGDHGFYVRVLKMTLYIV